MVVLFCVFSFQWLYAVTKNNYDEGLHGGVGLSHVLKSLACLKKSAWLLLNMICCYI